MGDLNAGSFFRKNGILTPLGPDRVHVTVGKNTDGSWYVDLNGDGGQVRSVMQPRQMAQMCRDTLRLMGYEVNIRLPEDAPIDNPGRLEAHMRRMNDLMVNEADKV
jgi:hypothetical protein